MGIQTENVAIVMAECDTCGRMESVPQRVSFAYVGTELYPLPPGWRWREDRFGDVECWPCQVLVVLKHMRHFVQSVPDAFIQGGEVAMGPLAEAVTDDLDLYVTEHFSIPGWIFAAAQFIHTEHHGEPNSMMLTSLLRHPPEDADELDEPATWPCPGGCGKQVDYHDVCPECADSRLDEE